jgi:hypothetical protein
MRLKRPEHDAAWEEQTWTFISQNRWAILGDMVAELSRSVPPLAKYTRWSEWERDILAHVAEPADCQAVIRERQEAIDDDATEASIVRDAFVAELKKRGHDAAGDAVFIPTAVAAAVVNGALGERYPVPKASTFLGTLAIEELRKSALNGARGWAWRGAESDQGAKMEPLAEAVSAPTWPR